MINRLVNAGAMVYELIPGSLGYGLTVVTGAPGYKSIVIREEYLNEWSSSNSVRKYNTLPAKYQRMINDL